MDVFISWSGERSRKIALALHDWLPKVINAVKPFLSTADIDKGARWSVDVSTKLEACKFGIICLTADNLHSDWLLFEAGALSKSVKRDLVCPLLIDLEPSDIGFPLVQFQAARANKSEIWALLKTINSTLPSDHVLSDSHLVDVYELLWPRLEQEIVTLPPSRAESPRRSDRELLEEVLALLHRTPITVVKETERIITEADLEDPILTIRLLLREMTEERGMRVPSYDFTWARNYLYLHLDAHEVSTRVGFRLPLSKKEARERLSEGLSRFERICDWDIGEALDHSGSAEESSREGHSQASGSSPALASTITE